MTSKINFYEPVSGIFSIARNPNVKKDQDQAQCLDLLNCLNLEKFGNDNVNFVALLINGHNSKNVVEKLSSTLKAEFCSKQFAKLTRSDDIMTYMENVLEKFEHKFLNDMGSLYKEKLSLIRVCSNLKSDNEENEIIGKIDEIDNELKSGATVAIAALIKGNIYISNIGDNQIILVANDGNSNDIDDQQFLLQTVEHSFHNEKEISRIKENCGLNPDALRWLSMLSHERCHSRCIGDYEMKRLYTQFDNLVNAKSSPLIYNPQHFTCIPYENQYTHILLISSGLFYLVRELIYDSDKVPGEISRKFFELKVQNNQDSLSVLCQKVLEFFIEEQKQLHNQYLLLMEDGGPIMEYSKHDDLSLFAIDISSHFRDSSACKEDSSGFEVIGGLPSNAPSISDSLDKDSSVKDQYSSIKSNSSVAHTPITAYVEFDEWDRAMSKLNAYEMSRLDLITNNEETFATPIAEESESLLASRSTTIEENKSPQVLDSSNYSLNSQGLYDSLEAK